MLTLFMDKRSRLGISLRMFAKTLLALGLVAVLAACGDSPGYNYTISGVVNGMVGSGLVLQNNGTDDVTMTSSGSFSFNTALYNGSSYSITIKTPPSNPSQSCVVINGIGSINGAEVTNVIISCTTSSHPVVVDPSSSFAFITVSSSNTIAAYTIGSNGVLANVDESPFDAGTNPINVTIYPATGTGKYAYVTNYIIDGSILAYNIDSDGALTLAQTVNTGIYPTALTVDPSGGQFAYLTNVGSNTVSAYNIDSTTGVLANVDGSPFATGTSPISVTINPAGTFAYVANLGSNTVSAYSINSTTGALANVDTYTVGTSPISVTINPAGTFAYVTNQGTSLTTGTVSGYTIGSTGVLTAVAGSPFNTEQYYPNPLTIDPTGKFAYVSNMGSNTISAYTINSSTGVLANIDTYDSGTYPNPVKITTITDGSNTTYVAYVSNMGTNNIFAYTINSSTGVLTKIGEYSTATSPNTVTIDPSGKYVYVSSGNTSTISAYSINANGTLSSL